MNISEISFICDNDCSITNIFSHIHTHASIEKKTVRSKGQYMMQRLFYICGGTVKFVLNDKRTVVGNKGSIIYLPPDVEYEAFWDDSADSAAISIRFDIVCSGINIDLSDTLCIISEDRYETYLKLFTSLANTYASGKIGYKIKCQSIFLDILYSLLPEIIKAPETKKTPSVSNGILYIENHYLENIDINYIAHICSMSASSFRSKFKKAVGMTPVQYKNYLKMKKASELLKTGEFTAQEVAITLGIDDAYYFNRLFKKYFAISPGKFKAQDDK